MSSLVTVPIAHVLPLLVFDIFVKQFDDFYLIFLKFRPRSPPRLDFLSEFSITNSCSLHNFCVILRRHGTLRRIHLGYMSSGFSALVLLPCVAAALLFALPTLAAGAGDGAAAAGVWRCCQLWAFSFCLDLAKYILYILFTTFRAIRCRSPVISHTISSICYIFSVILVEDGRDGSAGISGIAGIDGSDGIDGQRRHRWERRHGNMIVSTHLGGYHGA